jgi:hypothetical protein
MAALNVKVINSSANNPQARGKAESCAVQLVKTTMKKILATASSGSLN